MRNRIRRNGATIGILSICIGAPLMVVILAPLLGIETSEAAMGLITACIVFMGLLVIALAVKSMFDDKKDSARVEIITKA